MHDVSIGINRQDEILVFVPLIVVAVTVMPVVVVAIVPTTVTAAIAALVTTAAVAGVIVTTAWVAWRRHRGDMELDRQIVGATGHLCLDRLCAFCVAKGYSSKCLTAGVRRSARRIHRRAAGRPGERDGGARCRATLIVIDLDHQWVVQSLTCTTLLPVARDYDHVT